MHTQLIAHSFTQFIHICILSLITSIIYSILNYSGGWCVAVLSPFSVALEHYVLFLSRKRSSPTKTHSPQPLNQNLHTKEEQEQQQAIISTIDNHKQSDDQLKRQQSILRNQQQQVSKEKNPSIYLFVFVCFTLFLFLFVLLYRIVLFGYLSSIQLSIGEQRLLFLLLRYPHQPFNFNNHHFPFYRYSVVIICLLSSLFACWLSSTLKTPIPWLFVIRGGNVLY